MNILWELNLEGVEPVFLTQEDVGWFFENDAINYPLDGVVGVCGNSRGTKTQEKNQK